MKALACFLKNENSHKLGEVVYRRLGPGVPRAAAALRVILFCAPFVFARFAGLSTNLLPPGRQTNCHCDIFPRLEEEAIDHEELARVYYE